jgi:hypothetical protein
MSARMQNITVAGDIGVLVIAAFIFQRAARCEARWIRPDAGGERSLAYDTILTIVLLQ